MSSSSTSTNSVLIARLAYATARGEDVDEAWENKYEDNESRVRGSGVILVAVFLLESSVCSVLAKTLRKVGLPFKNSNRARRITHASIGLHWGVSHSDRRLVVHLRTGP